jgi:hypothetical protein
MLKRINNFEEFILEKRIAQMSNTVEITIGFDVIKTKHAEERSDFSKRGLSGGNQSHISNSEMKEFIMYFKDEITEGIATGDLEHRVPFVIKSLSRELSMVIIPESETPTYWKLVIKTVFRESDEHTLKVGHGQKVYNK